MILIKIQKIILSFTLTLIKLIKKLYYYYLISILFLFLGFHYDLIDLNFEDINNNNNIQGNNSIIQNENTEDIKSNNNSNTTAYKEIFLIIFTFLIFNLFVAYFNYTPIEPVIQNVEIVQPVNNYLNIINNLHGLNSDLIITEIYNKLIINSNKVIHLNKQLWNQVQENNHLVDLIEIKNERISNLETLLDIYRDRDI